MTTAAIADRDETKTQTTAIVPITAPATAKTTRTKKAQPSYVLFVIDASGSMSPKAADVRGGFNDYVKTLKTDESGADYRIGVVTFADKTNVLFDERPLSDVPQLDHINYRTGGNTALLDAIAISVDALTKRVATPKKPHGTADCLVIVMTDGEENASQRHKSDEVRTRIEERTAAGNWTFIYLGADIDAWRSASAYGFGAGNTASYTSAAAGGTGSSSALSALAQTQVDFNAQWRGRSISDDELAQIRAQMAAAAAQTTAGQMAGMTPAPPPAASAPVDTPWTTPKRPRRRTAKQ